MNGVVNTQGLIDLPSKVEELSKQGFEIVSILPLGERAFYILYRTPIEKEKQQAILIPNYGSYLWVIIILLLFILASIVIR